MSNKPKPDTLLGLTNSEQKILLLSILCTDESNKVRTPTLHSNQNSELI